MYKWASRRRPAEVLLLMLQEVDLFHDVQVVAISVLPANNDRSVLLRTHDGHQLPRRRYVDLKDLPYIESAKIFICTDPGGTP